MFSEEKLSSDEQHYRTTATITGIHNVSYNIGYIYSQEQLISFEPDLPTEHTNLPHYIIYLQM